MNQKIPQRFWLGLFFFFFSDIREATCCSSSSWCTVAQLILLKCWILVELFQNYIYISIYRIENHKQQKERQKIVSLGYVKSIIMVKIKFVHIKLIKYLLPPINLFPSPLKLPVVEGNDVIVPE